MIQKTRLPRTVLRAAAALLAAATLGGCTIVPVGYAGTYAGPVPAYVGPDPIGPYGYGYPADYGYGYGPQIVVGGWDRGYGYRGPRGEGYGREGLRGGQRPDNGGGRRSDSHGETDRR